MKTKILFVCLGNICRSPAAEGVFRKLIQDKGVANKFEVDSAGTGAWHVGEKADRRMRDSAMNRGVNLLSISRRIIPNDFHEFDFILTMDSDNLFNVKKMQKKIIGDSKAKVEPILLYSKKNNSLDVPDPYYGGEKGFEVVLDLLEEACEGFLTCLLKKG